MRLAAIACFGLAALLTASAAAAQDTPALLRFRAAEERPQMLVIGSAHFANPGRDLINQTIPDMMAPARQAEIEAVVAQLAALAPTHVAIEWPAARQAALDELYRAYLAGEHTLEVREAEQIGFRLAAAAGLERVDAVDWNEAPSGDEAAYDFPAYAESHGQGAVWAAIADPANTPSYSPANKTVAAWLREMNTPEALAASHRVYFDIAMIGGDDEQPGANWVGHWYGRNLRIFRNLVNLADSPQDRVVVIYGHGHAYLLNQLGRESGAFEMMEAQAALAGAE